MQKKNEKNKKITIDGLAVMVQGGFMGVNSQIKELRQDLSHKIDGLSNRIDDLSINRASREEVKILDMRLTKVEKKLHF